MGPLLNDTTALDAAGGGCLPRPGANTTVCQDLGTLPSPEACAAACLAMPACSAITWHDARQGAWALHCIARTDGVWAPQPCGAGCGHVAANKTAGWQPPAPPAWPPTLAGWSTGLIKPMWFGAGAGPLRPEATLGLMARHAVAGYGWQQGGGSKVGTGDAALAAASQRAVDYAATAPPAASTGISAVPFVYRQLQVALRLFAQPALASFDPANAAFWATNATTGEVCTAQQPWGTADYYWNFTHESAADYWVQSVIGELTTEAPLLQLQPQAGAATGAVFFDETDQQQCGYRGGSCDLAALGMSGAAAHAAAIAVLARTAQALNAAGIVPIYSSDNRLAASGDGLPAPGVGAPCALPEDAQLAALSGTTWVRFYETWPNTFWAPNGPDTRAAMIQNAILEGAAGVPTALHSSAPACPAPARNITRPGRLGGPIEFAVASYLVVASEGTVLSLSDGWMDENFCWWPEFDVVYGQPLGGAVRTGPYTWARSWTRANVTLDVEQQTGEVMLLA